MGALVIVRLVARHAEQWSEIEGRINAEIC